MAAFVAEDPGDRAAFDAHWERILDNPAVVKRAILYGGELAGSIMKFEMFEQANVAYGVRREFWGRGIASQALALFLEEVEERPRDGRAAADNAGSIRVLEKCGFALEGREQAFANGRGEEIEEVIYRLD